MKKNTRNKLIGAASLGLGVLLLASCTQNFCNDEDRASMAYPYEQGVTVYVEKTAYEEYKAANLDLIEFEEYYGIAGLAITGNENVYRYVPYVHTDTYAVSKFSAKKADALLNSVITSNTALVSPSVKFWAEIDRLVLEECVSYLTADTDYNVADIKVGTEADLSEDDWAVNPYIYADCVGGEEGNAQIKQSVLRRYGAIKFYGEKNSMWGTWDAWTNELAASSDPLLGLDGCPTEDFAKLYKTAVNNKVSAIRSCIATRTDEFGHYGAASDWEVRIEAKSWGYAWSKGFLEGLLVYPVSWLVDTFAYGMDPALTGVGQIWALVFVTLIVRLLLLAATFKSTMDGQKMQALQPQIAKLQAKYPNANTNQAEKARLSQEQMALYKRNKINPMSQLLMMIIQFPVFICVWAGLQGSAALSSGAFLNMRLSDTIQSILFNVSGTWYLNTTGWWTALILFLLMATTQIFSMLLPRIIQKMKTKNQPKLSKNPAQDETMKRTRWISIIMIGFTIVMGFFLPSAMGVYWFIGGVMSMIQTIIMQLIMARKAKKRD
ncbi:MAG: membrane protein insertase YidC [Bacilli bacterium]|nr:membrane protein insertase YidC [Bacilli bacterium]